MRLKKINIFNFIIFFVFSLYPLKNGYSQTSNKNYEDIWHNEIFDELLDSIYCVSETTGYINDYNKVIEEYTDEILRKIQEGNDPNEKDESGFTILIKASAFGFPYLVEKLLEIPEIKNNIHIMDKSDLHALDHAMQAIKLSYLFLNPHLRENIFMYIPFLTEQSYYRYNSFFQYKPYRKCVELLKKNGAEENKISLKFRMESKLKSLINTLLAKCISYKLDDEEKKWIFSAITEAQMNLEKLKNFKDGDDFGEFCIRNTVIKNY
jgi:hypothetical protein